MDNQTLLLLEPLEKVFGGGVYAVLDSVSLLVKIGRSRCVWERFCNLRTQHRINMDLRFLAVLSPDEATEPLFHDKFADIRERGEWFRPDPRLVAEILRARSRCPH